MHDINSACPAKSESPPLPDFELQDIRKNIHVIQEYISILNDAQTCLRSQISQLNTALEEDSFIPDILSGSLTDSLTKITTLQNDIIEKYEGLHLGTLPGRISSVAENLEKQEKLIAQKAVYLEAVRFFMGLRAEDPATQECLDQHKERLALYDCAGISAEECEQEFGKFVLLKNALEESDPKVKFSLLMQMNNLFELQIIYDININKIQPGPPEPVVQIPADSDSQPDPAPGRSGEELSGQGGGEAVSWESLGIEDPDSVTVHIDDSKLTHYESGKAKKFGVKDFKNDLSKIGRPFAAVALRAAERYGA